MNNDSGYTLLEVMVSIGMLAVAILGLIGAQVFALQSDGDSARKDSAVQILTAASELIESSAFDDTSVFIKEMGTSESYTDFKNDVKDPGTNTGLWLTSSDNKVEIYQRYEIEAGTSDVKRVYLIAAWKGIRSGEIETISRVITKPENFIQ